MPSLRRGRSPHLSKSSASENWQRPSRLTCSWRSARAAPRPPRPDTHRRQETPRARPTRSTENPEWYRYAYLRRSRHESLGYVGVCLGRLLYQSNSRQDREGRGSARSFDPDCKDAGRRGGSHRDRPDHLMGRNLPLISTAPILCRPCSYVQIRRLRGSVYIRMRRPTGVAGVF